MAYLRLLLGHVAVVMVLAGLLLAPGALRIDVHEGDLMHMVDGVMRMASGDSIHRDFLTPLGWLTFAPIALWTDFGIGTAMLAGGLTIAALLAPLAAWVGWTRGVGFAPAAALWLAATPVWGGALAVTSMAMHYNRWAWAITWLIVLQCLIPRRRGAEALDGALVGLGLAALGLMKATFAIALIPVVLIALPWRGILAGLAAGLAVVAAATLWLGPSLWPAYTVQLLQVALSDQRPTPGPPLVDFLTGAVGGPALALGLAAAVLWRRGEAQAVGRTALLLAPLMALVSWQNWGGEPLWLVPLAAALLVVPAPGGRWVAAVALGLVLPTLTTLAAAPLRHLQSDPARYVALIPGHEDLRVPESRFASSHLRVPDSGAAPLIAPEPEPLVLAGVEIPLCDHWGGYAGHQRALAEEIAAAAPGEAVYVADLTQPHWLFGTLSRVPGVALWSYGGAPGLANADALAVPKCSRNALARAAALLAAGDGWVVDQEGPRAILFRPAPAQDR